MFERDCADLRTKVAVPVTTASSAVRPNVPTITGSVRLKTGEDAERAGVPLKGHGMPRRRCRTSAAISTQARPVAEERDQGSARAWEALRERTGVAISSQLSAVSCELFASSVAHVKQASPSHGS